MTSIKIKSLFFLLALLLIGLAELNAQTITQTVRGSVIDKISQTPIPGAVVVVLNSTPLLVVSSSDNGEFKFSQVPVGKQSIKITYMGYKEVMLQNLSVNSGKELVLTVSMEEDVTKMEEIEITAKVEKINRSTRCLQ